MKPKTHLIAGSCQHNENIYLKWFVQFTLYQFSEYPVTLFINSFPEAGYFYCPTAFAIGKKVLIRSWIPCWEERIVSEARLFIKEKVLLPVRWIWELKACRSSL